MASLQTALKDCLCGCASGWGQVITMMPFENIKVKMVSKPEEYNQGYIHAFRTTIKEQGFLSLWKGMFMPLLGVGAQVALQFGIVESLKKVFKTKFGDAQGNLHWKYSFMCGVMAGLPSALVVTVLDHARFRVLLNKSKGEGSVKVAMRIYQQHGFKKLYLGFNSTCLREAIGLGAYFGTYDTLTFQARARQYNQRLSSLIAGGLSGLVCWLFMYPMDYAKTRIQTDSLQNPKYKNATQCLISDVKAKGLPVMFTGFPIMMARAFIVNAAGFTCFEQAKRMLY